jgi:Domain of unknown function (DUF5122) beta-propeller
MRRPRLTRTKVVATTLAMQLAVGGGLAISAEAATSPVESPTATQATADLQTAPQINGVVWSQAVYGNTVFAGGEFTKARPANAAAGTSEVTRNFLLAYNLSTGVLTSFAPNLNGQVLALAVSPDKKLYVGGSFTSINGETHRRLAQFDLAPVDAGANPTLVSAFKANLDASVNAVAASATTVYAGGKFTNANGSARKNVAAFTTSGGLSSWNVVPGGDSTEVKALALTTNNQLILGGRFSSLAKPGSAIKAALGMGAVSASNGDVHAWVVNTIIKNSGKDSAINSLVAVGTTVYGSGYKFGGSGNFEGTFAANAALKDTDPTQNGKLVWLADCHGDTYSVFPAQGALWVASHAHFCENIGGFPDAKPTAVRVSKRATAFTLGKTGEVRRNSGGSSYTNFEGQPSPSLINWFPDVPAGTYTGQTQAAWSVTATDKYVLLGGEFKKVNGKNQQGLARFQVAPAEQKMAPITIPYTNDSSVPAWNTNPTLSIVTGDVKVAWKTIWDRDQYRLSYEVWRDGNRNTGGTKVATVPGDSPFWKQNSLSFTDNPSSGSHSYRVYAVDNDGNAVGGSTVSITSP